MNALTSLGSTPFLAPVKSAAQPPQAVGQPETAAPGGDLADLSLPSVTAPEQAPRSAPAPAPASAPQAPVPVTLAMEQAPHT
ncbi:hypothetical protein DYH09_12480, partial [bacterium CPR1]|nr:hypothetical protein [bacterium CPR1]